MQLKGFSSSILRLVLVCILAGSLVSPTWAQEIEPLETNNEDTPSEEDSANTASTTDEPLSKEEQAAKVLEEVKNKLKNRASSLTDVTRNISLIEQKLEDAHEEERTLTEQLEAIDDQVRATEANIEQIEAELKILAEEIELTRGQIKVKQEELRELRGLLSDFIRFLHVQNIEIGTYDSTISQTLKLLFAEDQANDQLNELYFLELMEITGRKLFAEIKRLGEELELELLRLETKQELTVTSQKELLKQRQILAIEQTAKENLLSETQGKQEIYETLLLQAKQDQAAIKQDVRSLSDSYGRLSEQISFEKEQRGETRSGPKVGPQIFDGKLAWPVAPNRGISATFKDPSYRAALGVEHFAVDIRANMGTPLRAADDGVVYRVKGGEGLDYHYVMIAHSDGILTLYGHMYEISVTEGQYVQRGQVIGASGGMPGTRGAGYLTTGPHLHFEVFDNGTRVDPLFYLDLSNEFIEEKYVPTAYKYLIPTDSENSDES